MAHAGTLRGLFFASRCTDIRQPSGVKDAGTGNDYRLKGEQIAGFDETVKFGCLQVPATAENDK